MMDMVVKLRKPQQRILRVLSVARGSMTRQDISEIAEVDIAWVGDHVGKSDKADREARDELIGYKSLISLGYVEVRETSECSFYKITIAGRVAVQNGACGE